MIGIFGGTREGRLLAEFCHEEGLPAAISVATSYGKDLLEEGLGLQIHTGRMDRDEIQKWIKEKELSLVIDATHPYACHATCHIRQACREVEVSYLRLVRMESEMVCQEGLLGEETDGEKGDEGSQSHLTAPIRWVRSVEAAASYLKQELAMHPGRRALITTGSKELSHFAAVDKGREGLYARVLPTVEGIKACLEAGLKGNQIIAMQGPFSYEMNRILLKEIQASYLVTKESGQTGGFEEKAQAALDCGCQVIAVERPEKEEGLSLEEVKTRLRQEYLGQRAFRKSPEELDLEQEPEPGKQREITLVGIGMGDIRQITLEGIQAIWNSDAILGASRMVDCGRQVMQVLERWGNSHTPGTEGHGNQTGKEFMTAYRPEEILSWLDAHPGIHRPAILYSGDVGFYSGAKGLMKKIQEEGRAISCRLLPGISSMSAFAAKIGKNWEGVKAVSFHGREEEITALLSEGREYFFLLDGSERLHTLCRALLCSGQKDARLWVGERLSYPEEKIRSGTPEEFLQAEAGPLTAVWLVCNP